MFINSTECWPLPANVPTSIFRGEKLDRIYLDTLNVKPAYINLGIATIISWERVEIYTSGRPSQKAENKQDVVAGIRAILSNGEGIIIMDDREEITFEQALEKAFKNGTIILGPSKWWHHSR